MEIKPKASPFFIFPSEPNQIYRKEEEGKAESLRLVATAADGKIASKIVGDEALIGELLAALTKCDTAFASWQVGQIPGRPEDILALIVEVRAAIAKAEVR